MEVVDNEFVTISNQNAYPICVMIEPIGEDITLLPGQVLRIEAKVNVHDGFFFRRTIRNHNDLLQVGLGDWNVPYSVDGQSVTCGFQREHCPLHGPK